ncbi:MAG: hypothetical protein JXA58_05190 [Dehalococcoidia bacterium]|nr:hypothetical protein [Dehalococcoidia bacterium]
MTQTEAEKRFVEYHERLRAELNEGYWHFCAYTALEDAMGEYRQEVKLAPGFFQLTLRAHRLQALVPLGKLLDNSAGSTGVLQLLRHCEKNPGIFLLDHVHKRVKGRESGASSEAADEHTVVDWVQEDRKKMWDLPVSDINLLRDKTLAYIGKQVFEQGQMPAPLPHRSAIERCFQTLDEMLNRYSWAFDRRRSTMELPTHVLQRELDALLIH